MLALLICVLAASLAHARRRVVHVPTLGELCPGNAEWSKVEQCLRRQTAFTLERDERDIKLLRIGEQSRFSGLALYGLDRTWQVRGELRLYQPYEVLAFERIKLGARGAYRIDLGMSFATGMMVDDGITIPVSMRQKLTLVCQDGRSYCLQVLTACDVSYRGRALLTFRGTLVYERRELKVVGDRRNTGGLCQQNELVLSDP